MNDVRFAIVGGDLRSIALAKLLQCDKNKVLLHGFDRQKLDSTLERNDDLVDMILNSDIVIGPIPCSNDEETINAPFSTYKIYIKEVLSIMGSKQQLFMAGRISEKIQHLGKFLNINCVDLLAREELSVLNALPTAEGAIQIAMEKMDITLHGSNALVLGFGRIGKVLSKMLSGLGTTVTVAARKYSDIAWIANYGYTPILTKNLKDHVTNMDAIFNTVPQTILDYDVLKNVNRQCIIIDLASNPGGVDFDRAKELGLVVEWALSLPGKVAPTTSAKFIKDTIYNVMHETQSDWNGRRD